MSKSECGDAVRLNSDLSPRSDMSPRDVTIAVGPSSPPGRPARPSSPTPAWPDASAELGVLHMIADGNRRPRLIQALSAAEKAATSSRRCRLAHPVRDRW